MKMTGNTILITGGGTGIGRGLAEAFHRLGNEVIIAGRRQSVLDETIAANPGIHSLTLDIESTEDIERFAAQVKSTYPALNVLINNAGIMKTEDLPTGEATLPVAEQTIAINLLGPLRLTAALMDLLLKQPAATLMTVTSGLASVPRASHPTYCATKAAIHSWSESLRFQLRDTPVQVIELVPPFTQTELTGAEQATNPLAMPLDEYIDETMRLLSEQLDAGEILVGRVQRQRFSQKNGNYDEVFATQNPTS